MMKTGSWWRRLRISWRRPETTDTPNDGLPRVGEDGLLVDSVEKVDAEAESAPDRTPGPLTRWSKRDQTLAKLQEGYEQVTRVIQEIQNHLVTQADRSDRICNSLEQLAHSATELPAIAREQSRTLETIAAHIEATGSRTQQMAESLADVPKLAKAQSESLISIGRQLEIAGEQRSLTCQTLERMGSALGTLSNSTQSQTERLTMIGARTEQQVDLLTQTIARQNRRFIMLFVVTIALACAAIAAIAFLVWSGQRG
ncbi:MAG: methyl-accepting chemotaxis protein [Phycisphaerae bacterium]|nr:methyl-accepting chemotaxis protein [Phycisphaerae bacterium]